MTSESMAWSTTVQIVADTLGGLAVLFATFLAGLGRYHVRRLDKVIGEVSHVRERYVTRDDLVAALNRVEQSVKDRHDQNTAGIQGILAKIEKNADEAKTDRQQVRDLVHNVALNVATLTGKSDATAELAGAIAKLANRGPRHDDPR